MNIPDRIAAAYTLPNPPKLNLKVSQRQPVDPGKHLDHSAISGSQILFGTNVSVLAPSFIRVRGKESQVLIGNDTSLRGVRINVTGQRSAVVIGNACRLGSVNFIVRDDDCLVVIGRGTTFEQGAVLGNSGRSIIIGNDCMFSSDVVLRTSDGHGIFDATTRELINAPRDVIVGSHVWLGNGARVGKGAVIGGGTVIGQGAVVSGQIDGNSIYGGLPARLLRGNIMWSRSMSADNIPDIYAGGPGSAAEHPDPADD